MKMKKNYFAVFLTFYIALFCILGVFSWPKMSPGDDFVYLYDVVSKGFWPAQVHTFMTWCGRIFGIFLIDVFLFLPLEFLYQVTPLANIIIYAASIFTFIKTILPKSKIKTKILLTLIATASMLAFNYFLSETLYWYCGSIYMLCTSLIIFSLSFAIKALNGSRFSFFACITIIFLNGTTIEQPCVFEGILAFAAMIYFACNKDKKRALICTAFWLSAVCAFLCLYFAPGTAIRIAGINNGVQSFSGRFIRAFIIAGVHGMFTIIKFFVKPLVYVFLMFLPLIAKKTMEPKLKLKLWQIIILTVLIAPLMQILQAWSLGTGLPDRAVSLTLWFMGFIWFVLLSFFYRGRLVTSDRFAEFSKKWRYPFLILALLISFNFIDVVRALKIAPAYRAENILRIKSILQQKLNGV